MLKSKHTIAALIIAPLLSIGGYFMLDAFVGEKPHVAEKGQSYPLIALPNCRYSSGKCTMKNNEFKIDLTPAESGVGVVNVALTTAFPLQAAKMALVQHADEVGEPQAMRSVDKEGKQWQITLPGESQDGSQLRLVLVASDAFYFGETGLAFMQYDTAYHEDFREH